ncbi:hypothetical protein BATDEDRAFT_91584 [Batrachochytrium dendrobatidis JAM81]|uniref:Uncharacterized protein n=1 Tax=Batrachochytrium dendrobatidis (strain JAM81 / FGSC 10211) TaxID=684364 RepID=F4PAS7_BATDJ|nr:uncharacterized protein BATDEDRAFT_91584 [Batrachochytrium dendrobatidis JAM81]EGF77594.1 hypothetical protein BATDEDRAFT_91584 [Batrachochytrium dendrobatidis JAM81]|eukprot:XP_006681768.1 hypothetical protein BATDEDRAFT_91584 [Batrachochytrium dendrobatidis JAM81]
MTAIKSVSPRVSSEDLTDTMTADSLTRLRSCFEPKVPIQNKKAKIENGLSPKNWYHSVLYTYYSCLRKSFNCLIYNLYLEMIHKFNQLMGIIIVPESTTMGSLAVKPQAFILNDRGKKASL